MCVYIYILFRKYNWLSLYTVTYVSVFRADHLELDNELVSSSLGKTVSPTLSIP